MEQDTSPMKNTGKAFLTWASSVGTVVILGIATYAVYTVRQYIPIVGYVILVLAVLFLLTLLAWLLLVVSRYAFKAEVIELGPQGNVMKWYGKTTLLHPLGIQEHRGKAMTEKKTQEAIAVPSMVDLLREGLLSGASLLLGYRLTGEARYGTWADIKTFCIGGKSRSGKTVTTVFFIIQALLGGAEVWVCDPHYNKRTGLLRVLEPLHSFLRIARKPEEMVDLVMAFRNEMSARQEDRDRPLVPIVLVIDEWTHLLRNLESQYRDLLVDTVLDTAEAWADFEGYAILSGHEWTASESGGKKKAAIRRSFHATFVHRLDEDYAKFLLTGTKGKKASKNAPNFPTGQANFQDSEGELDVLVIPYYGKDKEAIIEASTMLGLPSGHVPNDRLIDSPVYPVNTAVNPKQPVNSPVNKPQDFYEQETEAVYKQGYSLQAQNTETQDTVNAVDLEQIVLRMYKRKVALRDIAYTVGLYGPKYAQFQALCVKLNIPLKKEEGASELQY